MFRLNRIRVKLSGSLKRHQCGILHNPRQSLKAHGEDLSDPTVPFFYSIATFPLDSTALILLHNQSHLPKQTMKMCSRRCRSLPNQIIRHKPGLCTTSSGFDHPNALGLMCFIDTRLHKFLSWIKSYFLAIQTVWIVPLYSEPN